MFILKLRSRIITRIRAARREYRTIWKHQYKVDLGLQPKWSLREKIKYNRLGFTNEDYYNYNLKENDYHNYISYRERLRLENINGRFADILGEKLMFERIFGRFIHVPHIYCWIKNGKYVDLDAGEEIDILSLIMKKNSLIAKPTRSYGGGTGVHILKSAVGLLSIDDVPVSEEQFCRTVSSWEESIIVEFVQQADYAKNVFSASTNTIRIITAKHKNGDYNVIMAFHRFGTEASKPVDNYSNGGLFASVDFDSGTLSAAKRVTEPEVFYTMHPDTQSQIEGLIIPNWQQLKEKLLHVHRCFPYYVFFAWDIVECQDGEPYVLEINRGSDLAFQMIQPQRNAALGQFMREYNLLDMIK